MSFPVINPGDIVRIVAPAWKGEVENLEKIKSYIESLGLVPEISPNIYNPEEPIYANTDEFRANDIISALLNKDCKLIWTVRGGFGCNLLLSYLEERLPVEPIPPKIFIGFSDVTAIHAFLRKRYNWPTIHGAMLEAIVDGTYDQSSDTVTHLTSIIFNRLQTLCYPPLVRLDDGLPLPPIKAPLVGGNLTMIETMIGTSWQVNTLNCILFMEDIWVTAENMERKLEHLRQAKIFDGVKAIIFGDFTDAGSQDLVELVLKRFAKSARISCPVFRVSGIGHEAVNFPLPLNTEAEILMQDSNYRLCNSVRHY